MPAAEFKKDGATLTVKPAGMLDTATAPELEKEMRPHLDGVREVIMDFTNVDYISSSGLRILLLLAQQMEERDGSVRLVHVNEYATEIFRLVGFLKVLPIELD